MADSAPTLGLKTEAAMVGRTSPVDHPAVIAACVGLAIAGFATFMGMPMMVGAAIDHYGYSEGEGGYVAAAEYLGMFAASALVSLLILRVSRRTLAFTGILTAILSNAASTAISALPFLLAIRFASGLGCGTTYAVAVAVLAGSRRTVRNFMFLIFGQVLTNAVVVYTFPSILSRWHLAGIFVAYCAILAAASLCVPCLPRRFAPAQNALTDARSPHFSLPRFIPWLCLFAVFCFYLMIGAYWAYIERIGVTAGFDEELVAKAIAAGILLSLLACLMAYRLSQRFGQSKPLLLALGAVAATLVVNGVSFGPAAFLIGLGVVNCLWNFTDIYQLGMIANIDHTGVFASRIQGAQMLAMTISPAIAGTLLDHHFGYDRLLILLGAYVATAFAAYSVVYGVLRRHAPTLADAK